MKNGFSVSALKYIAAVCMLFDHIAVIFLESGGFSQTRLGEMIDVPFRVIGRWSFPLFLFCLIQGYFHTRDKARYGMRLLIAAALSEIPYDFGNTGSFFVWEQNNVIWTMFLVVMMCMLYDRTRTQTAKDVRICYCGIIWAGFSFAAYVFHTDYGFAAITAATVLYFYQNRRVFGYGLSLASLCVLFHPIEAMALPTVFFVKRYNHQKGHQQPYFFYLFYPLHFVVLRIIYIILI